MIPSSLLSILRVSTLSKAGLLRSTIVKLDLRFSIPRIIDRQVPPGKLISTLNFATGSSSYVTKVFNKFLFEERQLRFNRRPCYKPFNHAFLTVAMWYLWATVSGTNSRIYKLWDSSLNGHLLGLWMRRALLMKCFSSGAALSAINWAC
ncbi:uncharacterized protein LY79DRAFT_211933 [Colletotrichum navitas]|uniref:Uncharacterized protein n=1 Tax=Colletotrichum navitas TaxID=681940 RepID=A0AAD8VBN6_9PEZI|nr:uncharacterized protein LY79DRAFT_211933 [Colletotrichum navitas]KAK1599196.1 hypothetical protein LY79DRAFT_211933 [Colletotrichum navitas]